jgi:hypothetical protein
VIKINSEKENKKKIHEALLLTNLILDDEVEIEIENK